MMDEFDLIHNLTSAGTELDYEELPDEWEVVVKDEKDDWDLVDDLRGEPEYEMQDADMVDDVVKPDVPMESGADVIVLGESSANPLELAEEPELAEEAESIANPAETSECVEFFFEGR